MSAVRDIFFDEFYEELERVVNALTDEETNLEVPARMASAARSRWHEYEAAVSPASFSLVAVDGGVQRSEFSHGWSVSVGRACALIQSPEHEKAPGIKKSVKVHLGRVFGRDRSYVPSYVRLIAEYQAALDGAHEVLKEGGYPMVLMDGSLYLSRFPYAEREYITHPELLRDMFQSIAELHVLARDQKFPVVGLAKDSSVFYLYMALLRENLSLQNVDESLASVVAESTSPFSLRQKMMRLKEKEKELLLTLLGGESPLCDAHLLDVSAKSQGFSHPLLLAPSIYYRGGDSLPSLYRRIKELMPNDLAESVVSSLESFFSRPTVALAYWRPRRGTRPFRVDISASSLGYGFPMREIKLNTLVSETCSFNTLEEVLSQLGYWFCNDLEYNLPLHQADRLARFDSKLYKSQYEPFIVKRAEEHGVTLKSRVRDLRAVNP